MSRPHDCVLGLDPGKTTGFALFQGGKLVVSGGHPSLESVVEQIARLKPILTHVVCEDYIGSGPRSTGAATAMEIIGAIKGACYTRSIPLTIRVPQARKAFISDAKQAVTTKGKARRHAIDAAAHVLSFLYYTEDNDGTTKDQDT